MNAAGDAATGAAPATGARLVEVSLGDTPADWAGLGFAVHDGIVGLGPLAVQCRGDGGPPALVFDRPHPTGASSFTGLPWTVGAGAAPPTIVDGHPNGIDAIDHVVITGTDAGELRRALDDAGLDVRRERAATVGDRSMVQLFAFAGDVLLELVAPDGPGDGDRRDRGDRGTDAAELWGLAVTAPDLDATVAALGDRCGPASGAVQAGRRIATVRTGEAGLSVRLAVMSPR